MPRFGRHTEMSKGTTVRRFSSQKHLWLAWALLAVCSCQVLPSARAEAPTGKPPATAAAKPATASPTAADGKVPRPRLLLVLSIDQMRFDYLERFGKLFTGGFKTLLHSGALFINARYRHA